MVREIILKIIARLCLLKSAYKVYSRIVNNRLETITEVMWVEEQVGFRKDRSCINNIFILHKKIIEIRQEFNLKLHVVSIDFKRTFYNIGRSKLWQIMSIIGFPHRLIQTSQRIYKQQIWWSIQKVLRILN